MNTTARISTAERLGRTLGRGWRAYVRGERRASNWLVSKGVPQAGASVFVWAIKLVVLGLLFYVAFWMTLLLVGLLLVCHGFRRSSDDFRNHATNCAMVKQDSACTRRTGIASTRMTPAIRMTTNKAMFFDEFVYCA